MWRNFSDHTGALIRHADFPSRFVAARHVEVWRTPEPDPAARYQAVYMHDGQNLFEPGAAYGGTDWGIDEALTALRRADLIGPTLVVGVWNSGPGRRYDYMPQAPLARPAVRAVAQAALAALAGDFAGEGVQSDAYLRFLTQELKPFIDRAYPTLPDRAHTAVMGSSMGGLISLYALTQYPEVFGAAGCVSTHWPAGGEPLVDYFAEVLPPPGAHRLYFDFGTATLDAAYEPYQRRLDARLRAAGYTEGRDWVTRKFMDAEHSERAWRARAPEILRFLLGT